MKSKIATNTPKRNKSCECLFCLGKCQKCGSTDVTVEYKDVVIYRYKNDTWNHIYIKRFIKRVSQSGLRIYCNKCGTEINENDQQGKKLFNLLKKYKWMPTSPTTKISFDRLHAFFDDNGSPGRNHFTKLEWFCEDPDSTYVTDNFSFKKNLGKLKYMKKIKK